MPSNAAEESEAKPPGPVMWTVSPSGDLLLMCFSSSTVSPSAAQPPEPASIGTMTSSACLSLEGIGPIESRLTFSTLLNCLTWPPTAAMSAVVAPLVRS